LDNGRQAHIYEKDNIKRGFCQPIEENFGDSDKGCGSDSNKKRQVA
jgi:hypothetical protein